MLKPLDGIEFSGARACVVQCARELFIEDLIDKTRLAGAGHARDAGERPERDGHIDMAEVVLRRAAHGQEFPVSLAALRRNGDLLDAGEILAGDRARAAHDVLQRPGRDDLAAVYARAGADVHDIIGGAHGVLVVLDDQNGVAEVAELTERGEELVVVALVQADRRLVEDVENAHQARTDLRGKADALAFAAGKRGCRA